MLSQKSSIYKDTHANGHSFSMLDVHALIYQIDLFIARSHRDQILFRSIRTVGAVGSRKWFSKFR